MAVNLKMAATYVIVLGMICLIGGASVEAGEMDGHRTGLVLGMGAGLAPYIYAKRDISSPARKTINYGLHFLVGYGWDDYNLLVYEVSEVVTGKEYRQCGDWFPCFGKKSWLIWQTFRGFVWYHYLQPESPSVWTALGGGRFEEEYGEDGYGALLGAGYEVARHVQVGAYMSFGRGGGSGRRYTYLHTLITVTGIAY